MKARIYFWLFILAAVAMLVLAGCGKGGKY
jgi:Prokaryotic membrane lipoprotein lipid attachment site